MHGIDRFTRLLEEADVQHVGIVGIAETGPLAGKIVQDENRAVIVLQHNERLAARSKAAKAEISLEHRAIRRNVDAGEIHMIELHWTHLSC